MLTLKAISMAVAMGTNSIHGVRLKLSARVRQSSFSVAAEVCVVHNPTVANTANAIAMDGMVVIIM